MSLESQLYEADVEFQMAQATEGDIARTLYAVSEVLPFLSKYDVFLSFRGFDTRKTFTDHLYKALTQDGYETFRDDNKIERGENIKSSLQKAIWNSGMSVIILSKHYANSTACLFELQTILECRKTMNHVILPVFYDVDPSEIKEQAEKLDFKNKTIEQVKVWSAALKEVASMAGIVSQNHSNGYEAKLVENILEWVDNKVNGIAESICNTIGDPTTDKISLQGPSKDIFLQGWQRVEIMLDYLSAQAEDVQRKLRSEMLQIWKTPKKEVEVWLRDVESWKGDVQRLKQVVFGESRVHSRVQLRKIIDKKIQEAAELQEKGRAFNDNLLVAFPIDRVLWMPPTNLESVEARNAERIREYLRETLSVM